MVARFDISWDISELFHNPCNVPGGTNRRSNFMTETGSLVDLPDEVVVSQLPLLTRQAHLHMMTSSSESYSTSKAAETCPDYDDLEWLVFHRLLRQ